MVLAYHLILTCYGFWLPNDPRGSWSDFVGAWELLRFGKATTVRVRHSIAGVEHDRALRLAAKRGLKYPEVKLSGRQARAIARGFAAYTQSAGLIVVACSIMPDHVHLVILRHAKSIEQITNQLKGAATHSVAGEGLHPLQEFPTPGGRFPKMWARGHWSVYLNRPADLLRAIRYAEMNPQREGLKAQNWNFVQEYRQ